MFRPVTGNHLDDVEHWVAELECAHNQHVRHDPPWPVSAWVTTEAGRPAHLGWQLQCFKCNRRVARDF